MRASVIVSELVTYIPAVVIFVRLYGRESAMSKYDKAVALAAILLQPALMLIDHGHFQYNAVMLGLTVLALDCFLTDHIYWGSFFFVLSLGFKQMALYYAPAVFAYLLGLCVFPRINVLRLMMLGVTVIASFTLVFAPLVVFGGRGQLGQCLFRVFPFARGLWEDKVANFWCATNVVMRFRERFDSGLLQKARYGLPPPILISFANVVRLVLLQRSSLFSRRARSYSSPHQNAFSRLRSPRLRGGSFFSHSKYTKNPCSSRLCLSHCTLPPRSTATSSRGSPG